MIKLSLIFLFTITSLLMGGNQFRFYDNLNLNYVGVNYIETGDEIFGFLPFPTMDAQNVDFLMGMVSINVSKGGDYREGFSRIENIDPINSLTFMWKHRKDFIPYFSYHTPFKAIIDRDLDREFHLRMDTYTGGIVSNIGKHCVSLGADFNVSGYKERYNSSEDPYNMVGGFSFRGKVDITTSKHTILHIGVITKNFLETDLDSKDDEYKFFNGSIINGVLDYRKDKFSVKLSTIYREFEKRDNTLNSWVLEQGLVGTYRLQDELRFSTSYYYIPSVYEEPESLKGVVHRLGCGVKLFIDRFYFNLGVLDSSLLSEKPLGETSYKVDIGYNFGR